MKSHELAKIMLSAPDGEITCSVDISTSDSDADRRCFGTFTEVNSLPTEQGFKGFGGSSVELLFDGHINH